KPSVLPEPVGARPQTSLPARPGGMADAWIGNGSVRRSRVRRTQRSSATPSAAKVVGVSVGIVFLQGSGRYGPNLEEPTPRDGSAALEGQAGDARVALVEIAVRRAGALGIDAEQTTGLQHLHCRVEGPLGRRTPAPPDRDLAHGPEEPRRLGVVEILGLGHEGDPPPEDERQEDRVGEREVVAGEDARAMGGHAVLALWLHLEQAVEQRSENPLEDPVGHGIEGYSRGQPPFLTARSSDLYRWFHERAPERSGGAQLTNKQSIPFSG